MFHKHKWELLSSRNIQMVNEWGNPLEIKTRLLMKCSVCCTHKSRLIKGRWSTEELTRKP